MRKLSLSSHLPFSPGPSHCYFHPSTRCPLTSPPPDCPTHRHICSHFPISLCICQALSTPSPASHFLISLSVHTFDRPSSIHFLPLCPDCYTLFVYASLFWPPLPTSTPACLLTCLTVPALKLIYSIMEHLLFCLYNVYFFCPSPLTSNTPAVTQVLVLSPYIIPQ